MAQGANRSADIASGGSYLPMLVVVYIGAFVASFNENIVNTGLVAIMSEFGVSSLTAQWLVTGYMVVTAVVVTFVGFLLKRYPVKLIFSLASAILLAGSVACALAPSFALLLIARLVASVGTGLFIPTMMTSVLALAPRPKLGTFLSIGGCMITFGPALAPVASGFMVTVFGWRTMFLIPAVVVACLLAVGLFVLKPIAEPEDLHLDLASVALSAVGLTVFVYGLGVLTTNLPVALVAVAAGLAVIAAFVRRQGRVDNPLLDLRPMANRRFWPACILVVVSMMTTFSMSVLLPMYFEGAAGASAFAAGALILIPILVNAGTSLLGGRVMDRSGEWPLLPLGFLLIMAGQAVVCLACRSTAIWPVVAASTVVYAGVGLVMSPSQTAGLKHLAPDLNPYGVAIMSTFIQVAACLGPSLFVGVLSSGSASALAAGVSSAFAQAQGFSQAVLVAAAIAAAGFALSLWYARGSAAAPQPARSAAIPGEPTLAQVMKTDVYQVDQTATVHQAVAMMLEHGTSGLPVTGASGGVVGFISDGDVMKALGRQDATAVDLVGALAIYHDDKTFEQRLAEVMESNVMELASHPAVCIDVSASIEEVCTLLGGRRLKKAPVLDGGRLAGTVSRTDVNRCLMRTFVALGEVHGVR